MVKSLLSIALSIILIAGLALFEGIFVRTQFDGFSQELATLTRKVEDETANAEDANAVRVSWEKKKEGLHVWIPHNDITRIDDYMSEAVRLIHEKEFRLALAKLEILTHLTTCLPDTYRPTPENIF